MREIEDFRSSPRALTNKLLNKLRSATRLLMLAETSGNLQFVINFISYIFLPSLYKLDVVKMQWTTIHMINTSPKIYCILLLP